MSEVAKAVALLEATDEMIQRLRIPGDIMFDIHNRLQDTITDIQEQNNPPEPWSIDDGRC